MRASAGAVGRPLLAPDLRAPNRGGGAAEGCRTLLGAVVLRPCHGLASRVHEQIGLFLEQLVGPLTWSAAISRHDSRILRRTPLIAPRPNCQNRLPGSEWFSHQPHWHGKNWPTCGAQIAWRRRTNSMKKESIGGLESDCDSGLLAEAGASWSKHVQAIDLRQEIFFAKVGHRQPCRLLIQYV